MRSNPCAAAASALLIGACRCKDWGCSRSYRRPNGTCPLRHFGAGTSEPIRPRSPSVRHLAETRAPRAGRRGRPLLDWATERPMECTVNESFSVVASMVRVSCPVPPAAIDRIGIAHGGGPHDAAAHQWRLAKAFLGRRVARRARRIRLLHHDGPTTAGQRAI